MRQLCIRFVAFGAIFIATAWGFTSYPGAVKPLLVLSAISFIAATFIRIKIWRDASDPYNLTRLNDLVQDGSYDEEDIPEVDHLGDKYCLYCQDVYGSQFGVCPKCGR
jgi:hypothetical protein